MIKRHIPGVLLLYSFPLWPMRAASTIIEHVGAFSKYSQMPIYERNTSTGFGGYLNDTEFDVTLLHYSAIGSVINSDPFAEYMVRTKSYKVAFFQDEFYYCQERFNFINRAGIDCIYTLVPQQYWGDFYGKYTRVPRLLPTLTGYVSDTLLEAAPRFTRPVEERTIDIGYRGRATPFYLGKGAREKSQMADEFNRCAGTLRLDIETGEGKRLYGTRWWQWLGNCKGCLVAEAGSSLFDLDGSVKKACDQLLKANPRMSFDEVFQRVLAPHEGNIHCRTISPRIFEAAAFGICMIGLEGEYQGVIKPMVHYIPLKKDYSNFDEVISLFKSEEVRRALTQNSYRDLIESGAYGYRQFIAGVDAQMADVVTVKGRPGETVHRSLQSSPMRLALAWMYYMLASIYLRLPSFARPWVKRICMLVTGNRKYAKGETD